MIKIKCVATDRKIDDISRNTLTAAQLIKLLNKYDDNDPVVLLFDDGRYGLITSYKISGDEYIED